MNVVKQFRDKYFGNCKDPDIEFQKFLEAEGLPASVHTVRSWQLPSDHVCFRIPIQKNKKTGIINLPKLCKIIGCTTDEYYRSLALEAEELAVTKA